MRNKKVRVVKIMINTQTMLCWNTCPLDMTRSQPEPISRPQPLISVRGHEVVEAIYKLLQGWLPTKSFKHSVWATCLRCVHRQMVQTNPLAKEQWLGMMLTILLFSFRLSAAMFYISCFLEANISPWLEMTWTPTFAIARWARQMKKGNLNEVGNNSN